MKKDDISRLLQHYLSAKEEGKEPYFDADQIDEMLDSFEDSNDYTYFDEVLALGLKLHPGNSALQIKKGRQFAYNEDYESALALLENIAETDKDGNQYQVYKNTYNYGTNASLSTEIPPESSAGRYTDFPCGIVSPHPSWNLYHERLCICWRESGLRS